MNIAKVPTLRDRLRFRLGVLFGVWTEGDHRDWSAMRPKRKVKSPLLRLLHRVMGLFGGLEKMVAAFEPFKPDFYLEEGQSLTEYGFDATVLQLPGHTPGSIAILTRNGDLIVGNTLENRGGLHPAQIVDDEVALAASVDRLAQLDLKTVYPGHGKPFTWTQFDERFLKKNRATRE